MSSPRITYTLRNDTSAEVEAAALSSVYRFVLDCHTQKEAAPESRPEDAERNRSDSASNYFTT